jgi:hypothetical protein
MKGCPLVAATIVVGVLLASCSHERGNQCGDDPRYARARTAAPVRIPDDLTPPDETDSLRLPQDTRQASAVADDANGRCLETPPKFGEAGAGRARSAQTPASGQARPAPGAPATPPAEEEPKPAGSDREISN